jgi:hypothetical protein
LSNETGVFVGGTARIRQHDLLASNGILHTIDSYMQARRTPCAAIPPSRLTRPSTCSRARCTVRVCVQPRGVPGIPPGQLPDTPPFANSTTARAAATGGLDLRSVGRRATHARCAQTWRHAPQRRPSRRAQMPRGVSGLHGACVWQDAALTVFMPTDAAWLTLCKGKQMMVDFLTGSAALRPTPQPHLPRAAAAPQKHTSTRPHGSASLTRSGTKDPHAQCPHACQCLPACTRFGLRWNCALASYSTAVVLRSCGLPHRSSSRVLVQMWQARAESRCRCGRVSRVQLQMLQ